MMNCHSDFKHEPKACPRCQTVFECKVGSVDHCQCTTVVLTDEMQQHIREVYNDCLCITCLNDIRHHISEAQSNQKDL